MATIFIIFVLIIIGEAVISLVHTSKFANKAYKNHDYLKTTGKIISRKKTQYCGNSTSPTFQIVVEFVNRNDEDVEELFYIDSIELWGDYKIDDVIPVYIYGNDKKY